MLVGLLYTDVLHDRGVNGVIWLVKVLNFCFIQSICRQGKSVRQSCVRSISCREGRVCCLQLLILVYLERHIYLFLVRDIGVEVCNELRAAVVGMSFFRFSFDRLRGGIEQLNF